MLINVSTEELERNPEGRVEIYAELNRKQYNSIKDGETKIVIPRGITMQNRAGSRALVFQCEDKLLAKMLEQGLYNSEISYQENFVENYEET